MPRGLAARCCLSQVGIRSSQSLTGSLTVAVFVPRRDNAALLLALVTAAMSRCFTVYFLQVHTVHSHVCHTSLPHVYTPLVCSIINTCRLPSE